MLISCVAYVNIVYLDLTSKTNFLRKSLRSVTTTYISLRDCWIPIFIKYHFTFGRNNIAIVP